MVMEQGHASARVYECIDVVTVLPLVQVYDKVKPEPGIVDLREEERLETMAAGTDE